MYKIACLFFFGLLSCTSAIENSSDAHEETSGPQIELKPMNVVFYNVENLYDTIDNPLKNDNQFLPNGEYKWGTERYFKKLDNIGKVLSSIDKSIPTFIGLAEIENREVLEDLIANSQLKGANYNIVHVQSPDERGADVAFLYQAGALQDETHEAISIQFPFNRGDRTRDILHISGLLPNNEAIHFFVVHLPSRGEGVEISEPKRLYVAEVLRIQVDEVLEQKPDAKILIIGDFNDYPDNKSLQQILVPGLPNSTQELINVSAYIHDEGRGSISYKGEWGLFDQMIASKSLLGTKGYRIKNKKAYVFEPEWLIFTHPKYKSTQPDRTYSGPRYHGGFSDHLPVFLTLEVE